MSRRNKKPGAAARTRYEERKAAPYELPDSLNDELHMQPEETTISLPDVADIPGQEHIRSMPFGIISDTTISSDDEEGVRVFGDKRNRYGSNPSEE